MCRTTCSSPINQLFVHLSNVLDVVFPGFSSYVKIRFRIDIVLEDSLYQDLTK